VHLGLVPSIDRPRNSLYMHARLNVPARFGLAISRLLGLEWRPVLILFFSVITVLLDMPSKDPIVALSC
jgi:hypothetical protein